MSNGTCQRSSESLLDWFTHDILPDGRQICSIGPFLALAAERIVHSRVQSALMQTLLSEIAREECIPFVAAKQAALRAFVRVSRERPSARRR